MNPKFWGPHGWIFLHTVTMNYPKEPNNQDKTLQQLLKTAKEKNSNGTGNAYPINTRIVRHQTIS